MNSIQWCVSNLSNIVKQQQHHNRHTHTLPYNWIVSTLYHIPYFIRICFMMLMLNATKNGAAQQKTKLINSQAFDYDDYDRKRTNTTLCFVYFAAEDHLEKFEFTKCKSPWKRVNHKMNMKWCQPIVVVVVVISHFVCFSWLYCFVFQVMYYFFVMNFPASIVYYHTVVVFHSQQCYEWKQHTQPVKQFQQPKHVKHFSAKW